MTITDTLRTARRLEQIGFTHEQAHGLADLLEETAGAGQPDLSHLATKDDLAGIREYLRTQIESLESRLESRFERGLRQQMLWFFAMLVAIFGAAFALARFLLAG